jgi:hypothetical protein
VILARAVGLRRVVFETVSSRRIRHRPGKLASEFTKPSAEISHIDISFFSDLSERLAFLQLSQNVIQRNVGPFRHQHGSHELAEGKPLRQALELLLQLLGGPDVGMRVENAENDIAAERAFSLFSSTAKLATSLLELLLGLGGLAVLTLTLATTLALAASLALTALALSATLALTTLTLASTLTLTAALSLTTLTLAASLTLTTLALATTLASPATLTLS